MFVAFSVVLKMEIKATIRKVYFNTGFSSQQFFVQTIKIGVAIQCSKQIEELAIPTKSA